MIAELDEQIKSLQANWEDVTQTRFHSDYQHWHSQMQQSTQLLWGITEQLLIISNPYIFIYEDYTDR